MNKFQQDSKTNLKIVEHVCIVQLLLFAHRNIDRIFSWILCEIEQKLKVKQYEWIQYMHCILLYLDLLHYFSIDFNVIFQFIQTLNRHKHLFMPNAINCRNDYNSFETLLHQINLCFFVCLIVTFFFVLSKWIFYRMRIALVDSSFTRKLWLLLIWMCRINMLSITFNVISTKHYHILAMNGNEKW